MNEIAPLVSVVMPVFNTRSYLDEAIASIMRQTFPNFELIIINDGSTDGSLALARQWEKKDRRIRVFDQSNKGRSFSRNRGLELATTEFIVMMDSDDIAEETRLQLCYEYLQNNSEAVAVSGQYERVCMYGVPLQKSSLPLDHKSIVNDLLQDKGDSFTQGASMYKKSLAQKVGGYNLSYDLGEDADLFLRMALHGELINLPDVLLKYRRHPNSITSTADEQLVENCIKRLNSAWLDRGLLMDSDFEHYLKKTIKREKHEDILQFGWNALNKGETKIARRYAKSLFFSKPFSLKTYRFLYCALRGR